MNIVIAAGGTGGHLFPAEALATALASSPTRRSIHLVTDARAKPLLKTFPADEVHFIAASTLASKNPLQILKMGVTNLSGLIRSIGILKRAKADVAVGFGGYPTLPPLIAAKLLKIPVVVHEANAVMGRANRLLSRGANVVTSFPYVGGVPASARSVQQLGMPVRRAVLDAAAPYAPAKERFRLLVFGGSQGARVFADLMPPVLEALGADDRQRLELVQQVRAEDMERVRTAYDALGVEAELAPFFPDLPAKIAAAHLVIGRSGASTVAELAVIGRPSLLVPLPGAVDQDQAHNAAALEDLGGAKRLIQAEIRAQSLAFEISALLAAPDKLAEMAAAAKGLARPGAASDLAHHVSVVGGAVGWSENVDEEPA